jgi:hypothetical protein
MGSRLKVLSMEEKMPEFAPLMQERLTTPRAAAIAGILFSVLLTSILVIFRISVPPASQGTPLPSAAGVRAIVLALHLTPFTGIAFLWFVGVLRDRLGECEDRFFATVFFGSAILFLAMLFVMATVVGAIIIAFDAAPNRMIESGGYDFGRAIGAQVLNVYALKMAAVFMFSAATMAIRTRVLPRWVAILGYALASMLLAASHFVDWLGLAFPLWVFISSVYILMENLRGPRTGAQADPMEENIRKGDFE